MNHNRVNEITALLPKLITLDIQARVSVLQQIMHVYQQTFPFVRMSLDVDAERRLEKANKAAALGFGGKTKEEQEQAYSTAIRIYEGVYERLSGWGAIAGSLNAQYAHLNVKREELIEAKRWAERKQAEFEVRYQPLVTVLNETFGRFGVSFRVDFEQSQPRLYNASKQITLGRDYLVSTEDKDPLRVIFDEAHTVAKALSVTKDSTGRAVLDMNQINALFPQILAALYDLTQRQQIKVKVQVSKKVVSEKVTTERRWKHVPTVGKGGGLFRPGTYLALLYDRIVHCPGITFDELFDGVPAKDRERMFATIAERGLVSKKFTLTRSGGKVVFAKS